MTTTNAPIPEEIRLQKGARVLVLSYSENDAFALTAEYLRVHSPSAEVRGHAPGQEVLQVGKENVAIRGIEPVGHYAVRLVFDDGHDSGIYTWAYLRELCLKRDANWRAYLDQLTAAGYPSRKDADE